MRRPLGAILSLALALAGCGGDEGAADASRTPAEVRKCLGEAGFLVTGGPRSPDDTNAPDTELIVGGGGVSAFIGFYDDLDRAQRYEPDIRARAKRFSGVVKRRDRITVLWVREPATDSRARVERCVF